MFQGIEHLAIASPNPEKLAQWYVDHLGFDINYSYAGNYFVRAANGAMIEIIPAANSLPAPQVMANNKDAGFRHLAIAIDDFDAGVAHLRAKALRWWASRSRRRATGWRFSTMPTAIWCI